MTPPLPLTGSIRKSTKWIKSTRKTRGRALEGCRIHKGRFRSTTPTATGTVLASARRAKSLMPRLPNRHRDRRAKTSDRHFRDLVQKTLSLLEPPSGELRVVSMAQGCRLARCSKSAAYMRALGSRGFFAINIFAPTFFHSVTLTRAHICIHGTAAPSARPR